MQRAAEGNKQSRYSVRWKIYGHQEADESGRRLYLNTEFDEQTGIDRSRKLVCRDLNAIRERLRALWITMYLKSRAEEA